MLLDNNLILCGSISAAGALTGQAMNGAGNVNSANTIDLGPLSIGGNQAGDSGAGEATKMVFTVLTAPTVGTNVQFQLIQADDAALSSNVQVIVQTDAFPIASLPAGTVVPLHLDRAAPYVPKRYMGARVVNTGAIATLSVFGALVKNVQDVKNLNYKSGFAVS
ncbi:MAG: hypothetical protein JSR19_06980 [Proteobacteria bacterium]|nr:hypothetical protein [Pseudomonadota bacterium]